MNKKTIVIVSIAVFVVIAGIVSSWFIFLKPCDHQWQEATCESSTICTLCGETVGEPIGHHWRDADCNNPETCSDCDKTRGDPLGHEWINVTCVTPTTCSVCGKTEGEAIGHDWLEAKCSTPKTCSVCGETEGEPLGHNWIDATYDAPKTCDICGETEGEALTRPVTQSYTSTSSDSSSSSSSTERTCMICGNTVYRSDTIYCSNHDCTIGGCSYPAKCKNGIENGSYCVYHSCQYQDCLSTPIGITGYCGAHNE